MRSKLLILALGITVLAACNHNKVNRLGTVTGQNSNQNSAPNTFADGAPRITIPDLQEKIKKNEVFILDVRNQASYDAGHIPNSKLIPSGEILNHIDELPKDKLIVTYCS